MMHFCLCGGRAVKMYMLFESQALTTARGEERGSVVAWWDDFLLFDDDFISQSID